MHLEIAFVVLATVASLVYFVVLLNTGDSAPVEPDGWDDPGPVEAIVTIFYVSIVLSTAVLLVVLFEVVMSVLGAFRRDEPPRT